MKERRKKNKDENITLFHLYGVIDRSKFDGSIDMCTYFYEQLNEKLINKDMFE